MEGCALHIVGIIPKISTALRSVRKIREGIVKVRYFDHKDDDSFPWGKRYGKINPAILLNSHLVFHGWNGFSW